MPDGDNESIEQMANELRGTVPVSAGFDARVMRAVRAMPRHARRVSFWRGITTPRTLVVTPWSWGLVAASVLVFAGVGVVHLSEALHSATGPVTTALFSKASKPATQRVQFVLVAPDAKKVAVVGDFNGWDASHAAYQAKHRGGGVWSVTAPIPVGHHRYSFVVDDSVWVADPTAPRAPDNDFGLPNSAIVVEADK